MFFVQVVRGRPGGRLQLSGGGSKMVWLASVLGETCGWRWSNNGTLSVGIYHT